MTRRGFSLAFLMLTAFATSGCVTALLVDAAREQVVTEYSVSYVESAWRDDDGGLTICYYGWPTGKPESGPARPYTMTVPAGALQSLTVASGTVYNPRNVLAWPATVHNIKPGCRDAPPAGLPVAVQRYSALAADGGGAQRPLYEVLAPADLNRTDPVVYSLDHAGGPDIGFIVYQHDAPLAGGARFVRFDLPYEQSYEYNAAIFLIPVTLVVDTALVIGYLYLCSQAAASC